MSEPSNEVVEPVEVDNYLWQKIEGVDPKHVFRTPRTFYISELPYCASHVFFQIKFNSIIPPNYDMKMGRILHAALPELLKDDPAHKGAKYEECVSYYDEINKIDIRGRADCMLATQDVIEEWKFGLKKISPFDTVPATYLVQLGMYVHLKHKPKGILYYVHRYTFEKAKLEIDAKASEEVFEKMRIKAKQIQECLDDNHIPEFNSPMFEWECGRCPFTLVCPAFFQLSREKNKETPKDTSAANVEQSLKPSIASSQDTSGDVQTAAGENASIDGPLTPKEQLPRPIIAKHNLDLGLQVIKNMTVGGKAVERSSIISELVKSGLDEETANNTVLQLYRAGLIYEPRKGYLMVL